ncbi:MAG: PAS domain S-box protein, partial [Chloroflexota bacterium]|nr:PAS domain S-box protein [Chloroflexota bacterium]
MELDDVSPSGVSGRQQIDLASLNGATSRSVDPERIGARVVEDVPDLVAVLDSDLICRYANPAWEAVLGYRPDVLIGRPIATIEHPLDPSRTEQFLDALALRPGEIERWDVRVQHRDGSSRWLEIVARHRRSDPALAGFLLVARDVTQRKASELALRRGEARFRALVHHSSDIITIIDADGIARYQSPSLEHVLGYAPEELVGADPFTLIHPEEAGPVRELFEQVVSQPGASECARFRFRHKDGSWRWLEVIGTNLLDDPSVNGVVVNSRDVTDRQRAEDDLREREQWHREVSAAARRQAQELALLEEVRTALAREIELPELIRTVVEAIERTFGYTLVSLYLLEGDELVLQHQVGYEQSIRRIPITAGTAGRVVRTGKPVLLEDVSADPAFLGAIEGIVSEVCVPLNDQGRVVGILNVESTSGIHLSEADLRLMIALSEHVTIAIGRARLYGETRASAARFQALVQYADLMGIIEREGEIRYLSPAVEAVLGYAPEELLGTPSSGLVHVDDRAAVLASFARARVHPGSQHPVECRMQRKDGTFRWIEIRFSNLLADLSVEGIVLNGRDVTERKQIEAQLRHQAQHDPLTGLPNRALFLERLTQELGRARSRHDGRGVPVLFLDLDGFKVVNDSLGHAAGDRLLVAVAERLTALLRVEDVIARFGGDEFAVLLSGSTDLATAIN